jgi:hypothetical protein
MSIRKNGVIPVSEKTYEELLDIARTQGVTCDFD